MITNISIKNFRSINTADINTKSITSFVGPNDAGKSNILRALNLFFNGHTDHGKPFNFNRDFNKFAPARKQKAKQIEIILTIELPYSYRRDDTPIEVEWTKIWRSEGEVTDMSSRMYVDKTPFPSRSKIPTLLDRMKFTYIPAIKDEVFFADLQGKIYDVLSSVAYEPLKISSESFENQIQEQLKDLLNDITKTFKFKASMTMPQNLRPIFESLEINSEGMPLSQRGDGIKIRHIPMILRFVAEQHDNVMNKGAIRTTHIWGFEEPENNVEMSAAFEMA